MVTFLSKQRPAPDVIRADRETPRRVHEVKEYLRKHQLLPFQVESPPSRELGLVVVIPCYDEPALLATLDSLRNAALPACDCEVLIVINASEADAPEVHAQNRRTRDEAEEWISMHSSPGLAFHVMDFPHLPSRHAGVGLARKLGMDEAADRLAQSRDGRGVIVCLDADCVCDSRYLTSIHDHFRTHRASPGASVYFEHVLDNSLPAVAGYELFLRYYVEGLRFSGFPHAFHTVGSCMAVRSEAYVRAGGMNRRRAGEDFYFLHKLTALGRVTDICSTTVYPASRPSHRVPFGTGRTVSRRVDQRGFPAYAPEIFRDLKHYLSRVDELRSADPDDPELLRGLPATVSGYLAASGFPAKLRELQENTASRRTFRQRFFQWQNGFRTLKYVHYATETTYAKIPVCAAAATLLGWRGEATMPDCPVDEEELLQRYRRLARNRGA